MNIKQLIVLLADDDTDDCIFFKEAALELIPASNFRAVNDGEQLMEYLTQIAGAENIEVGAEDFLPLLPLPNLIPLQKFLPLPDVLFLDLNMPRKNGFECLEEIKKNEQLKRLPVIIFSTSFEQEVVNQLYQSGAHYFIRKPSVFSQFKKIIQQTLTRIANEISANSAENILQPPKENFVLTLENNR